MILFHIRFIPWFLVSTTRLIVNSSPNMKINGTMIDLRQSLFYLSQALGQIKKFMVLFVEVIFLFQLEHIRQEKSIRQLEGYGNILRNSNQVIQLWNKLVNSGSK